MLFLHHFRVHLRNALFLSLILVTCLGGPVSALTTDDIYAIKNWPLYKLNSCTAASNPDSACVGLTGNDNRAKAFNFLVGKGLTAAQAAGIVGNLDEESGGVDPTSQEDGSKDPMPKNGVGFGIAQWTWTVEQKPLVDLATKEGKPATALCVQLDYLWNDMNTNPRYKNAVFKAIKAITGNDHAAVQAVTQIFMDKYEVPGIPHFDVRLQDAYKVFDKYGSTAGSTATAPTPSTPSVTATPAGGKTTIALDPGHAPSANEKVDKATDMSVMEYENDPEMQQVWDVAQTVAKKLTQDGYNVVFTKKSVKDSNTNLKQRADDAAKAGAVLGVSIHTSPGHQNTDSTVIIPTTKDWRLHASDPDNVNITANRAPYKNAALAATDQIDGKKMADARSAAMGGTPVRYGSYYYDLYHTYLDRSVGNITQNGTVPVTEYFATIPWVYNEQWQDAGGGAISPGMAQKYATGLINGIEKIVSPGSGGACGSNNNTVTCNNSTGAATSSSTVTLSATRQNVVCVAQQELQLWDTGKMFKGYRYNNPNSYTKYSDNSDELWCADFASWVYKQAGYPFTGGTSGGAGVGWRLPAVSQIMALGQQNGKFHWHPKSSNYTPKPGDLAIHKGPGISHVNIYIKSSGGKAYYIGGDQHGSGGADGNVVNYERGNGYYDSSIIGYVSPD